MSMDIPAPMPSIRKKCLWCVNGSSNEIKLCPVIDCSLHPYRFGKKPNARQRQAYTGEIPTTLASIRAKCLDCSSYSTDEVKNCMIKTCALWPYRLGKSPNREGFKHSGSFQKKISATASDSDTPIEKMNYEPSEESAPENTPSKRGFP